METKPYSIQSPEQIAKDYGGNKQKIAEAMQMGIIDPTAGTLAGMFIDRMRSAAQAEQAPQQTVAQKTFAPPAPPAPPQGGLPPAPMGAPPMGGAPAGLGATPEAAQMAPMPDMPAPEMAAPEMPQQEAPMGMAEGGMVPPYASGGGLSDVPIPSGMFDEPDNGSYANGGIVAFAGGGFGSYFEDTATKAIPGLGVTSRQRNADKNASVGGVSNSFHLTDDARDFVPPMGMSMAALHAKLKNQFGSQYDVINEGDHVHIEPGPGIAKSGRPTLLNPAQAANPQAPMDVPGGKLADQMMPAYEHAGEFYDKFMPKPKTEARDKMKARVQEQMSEESQKKEKDYDKWSTLAEIGFNIAGSNSPNFLQAVGAAASAALPGAKQAKKDREARADKLLTQYAEIEGIENAEARERVKFMIDFGKTELDLKDKDLTRGVNFAIQKMQDVTQNRNITEQAASSKYSADKQFTASMANSSAQADAVMKQGYNLAYQAAQDDVKAMPEYINGDEATRTQIFNNVLAQKIAAYERMTGGRTSGGGAPQMPAGFVPDKR